MSSIQLFSYGVGELAAQAQADELLEVNQVTAPYGLELTAREARGLVTVKNRALKSTARIELGGGLLPKLASAFCDSPWINSENYASTLAELLEIFYYYKGETLELIGDDELIDKMKEFFDGTCRGDLKLLAEREMDIFARNTRFGYEAVPYPSMYPDEAPAEEDELDLEQDEDPLTTIPADPDSLESSPVLTVGGVSLSVSPDPLDLITAQHNGKEGAK